MKYLILENGMIVESDKTATMKDSVPFFDIDSSSFERIRIISEANTLSIAKQRLIEYCSDKPCVLIALWVRSLQRQVTIRCLKNELKAYEKMEKDRLIAKLIKYNEMKMKGEYIE